MKTAFQATTRNQVPALTVSAVTARILDPLRTAALQTMRLADNKSAPAPQPISKRRPTGPIHRIIQGECLAMMAKIPDHSIDFICADFPYNISGKGGLTMRGNQIVKADFGDWDKFPSGEAYLDFVFTVCAEYRRILRPNASLVLFF